MKKTLFTLLLFFSLSFSYWLNLHKPIEPLKKEISILINYDKTLKNDFKFIFLDLYNDKTKDIKFRLKMLNAYLYLWTK